MSSDSQKLQDAYGLIYIFGQIFFSLALVFSLAIIVYIFVSLKRKDRAKQTIVKPEIILILSLWVVSDLGLLLVNNIEYEIDKRRLNCNQCTADGDDTRDCKTCETVQPGLVLGYFIGVFLSKLIFLTFWKVACIYAKTASGLNVDRQQETSLEALISKKQRQLSQHKVIEVTVVAAIILLDCLFTTCMVEWYVVVESQDTRKKYVWRACSLLYQLLLSLIGICAAGVLAWSVNVIHKRVKEQELEIKRRSQANKPSQLEIQLNTKKLRCYSVLTIGLLSFMIVELCLIIVSDAFSKNDRMYLTLTQVYFKLPLDLFGIIVQACFCVIFLNLSRKSSYDLHVSNYGQLLLLPHQSVFNQQQVTSSTDDGFSDGKSHSSTGTTTAPFQQTKEIMEQFRANYDYNHHATDNLAAHESALLETLMRNQQRESTLQDMITSQLWQVTTAATATATPVQGSQNTQLDSTCKEQQ